MQAHCRAWTPLQGVVKAMLLLREPLQIVTSTAETSLTPQHQPSLDDNTMTVIGATLVITGQVTSHEDVTIHGRLVGKISVEKGALLIAQGAQVEAEADVARLTVHGAFSGGIEATERVELTQTANVSGTLIAPAVVLHDGAVFNGSIEVVGGKKKGAAEPRLAKAS